MKSKEDHFINGTFRADRHENKVDAYAIDEIPKAPDHLSENEAEIFNEIAAKMFEQSSLSSLDIYSLECYAVQLSLFRRAKRELETTGQYIMPHTNKGGSTNLVPSPWLTVLKNSSDILLKLSAKFGFTPVDRNKANKVSNKKREEDNLLL